MGLLEQSAMGPRTIGIVGSRRRSTANDMVELCACVDRIRKPGDRVVSGGCKKGADDFAEYIARARGMTIIIHHADWNGPAGKAAGFVRNDKIAEDCSFLIALPAKDRTGGTEDTIAKARKLGKEVILL